METKNLYIPQIEIHTILSQKKNFKFKLVVNSKLKQIQI